MLKVSANISLISRPVAVCDVYIITHHGVLMHKMIQEHGTK